MRIEFDSAKDESNREKHGLSLALASSFDWDQALVWIDERYEYNELRMVALVPDIHTMYYVAFVDRGGIRRVISLRKANRREAKRYVQHG